MFRRALKALRRQRTSPCNNFELHTLVVSYMGQSFTRRQTFKAVLYDQHEFAFVLGLKDSWVHSLDLFSVFCIGINWTVKWFVRQIQLWLKRWSSDEWRDGGKRTGERGGQYNMKSIFRERKVRRQVEWRMEIFQDAEGTFSKTDLFRHV